jgi:protein gp37
MTDVAVTLTLPPSAEPVARRRPSGIDLIDETIKALIKDATDISWAHLTFNPWAGCAHRSPACDACYAETQAKRFTWGKVNGQSVWGVDAPRHMMSDAYWRQPAKWNRLAAKLGVRLRVFCASIADVFDDHPDVVDARARLWATITATPNLDWLLLTKRPENIARMVPPSWMAGEWPANVWVGSTMETQRYANLRTRHLRSIPAPVIFASGAPLLGPVVYDLDVIDWVITEGESGHAARPSRQDWFRAVRDQCAAAGIPYHHKQHGEYVTVPVEDDPRMTGGRAYTHPTGARCAAIIRLPGRSGTMRGGVTRPIEPGESTNGSIMLDHDTLAVKVGTGKAGRAIDGVEHMQVPVSPGGGVAA